MPPDNFTKFSAMVSGGNLENNSEFPPNLSDPQPTPTAVATGTTAGRTRDEDLAKFEVALLACIFLITIVGNFIVITGIYFRRQKMTRMYYFILHLSLADLITAFFNVGTQFVMELTWPVFLGGNVFCKVIKYLQILGPYSSSYVLVMTALDRYQAICYPMSNCNWTARQSKFMLGCAWGLALLFCSPQIFIFSLQEVAPGEYDCWATFPDWGAKAYVTWYSLSFFIIPLLILIFAYTCICRTIWLNVSMKNTALKMVTSEKFRKSMADPDSPEMSPLKELKRNTSVHDNMMESIKIKETQFTPYPTSLNLSSNEERNQNGWNNQNKMAELDSSPTQTPTPTPSSSSSRKSQSENTFLAMTVKYNEENRKNISVVSQIRIKIRNTFGFDRSKDKNQILERSVDKNRNRGSKRQLMFRNKLDDADENGRQSPVQMLTRASTSPNFTATTVSQPRTHSVKGISRAKIKTVKLTVTVIVCYFICSSPFIAAQLWSTYDPLAHESPFYTGTVFTILTLLASLNSCVNPWLFLFFNPNLLQDFTRGCRGHKFRLRRRQSRTSPVTGRTSVGGTQNTR